MTAEAKCAYCGTLLNPGARVCHPGARRQPLTPRQRKDLSKFFAVLLFLVIAFPAAVKITDFWPALSSV